MMPVPRALPPAVFLLLLGVWLSACKPSVPASIAEVSSAPGAAFFTQTFRAGDDHYAVSFVSDSELEMRERAVNVVLDYTRKGNAIRAVGEIGGSRQALYFEFVPKGLRDARGRILYDVRHFEEQNARKSMTTLLANTRSLQQVLQMAALDNASSGKNYWPTERVASKRELQELLVKEGYFTSVQAENALRHMVIGKVTATDASNTILAISNNAPGIASEAKDRMPGDSYVIFTKGGRGGVYPISKGAEVMKDFYLPALLPE